MSNYDWRDRTEIERFIREWPEQRSNAGFDAQGVADPLEELQLRLDRGDFRNENYKSVASYLKMEERRAYLVSDEARADREERMTQAAEDSAAATKTSAIAALVAIGVSVLALVVAFMDLTK